MNCKQEAIKNLILLKKLWEAIYLKMLTHTLERFSTTKLTNQLKDLESIKMVKVRSFHRILPVKECQYRPKLSSIDTLNDLITSSPLYNYFDLYIQFSSIKDVFVGFALQLINDLFLYDFNDCYFWLFDMFTDFINGALLLVQENSPMDSLVSFTYSFHKAPKAYNMCNKVFGDLVYLTLAQGGYNSLTDLSG